ncbi:MAG: hypothetical protein AAFV19_22490 [Pseudomonadota bacterium]
MSLAKILIFGGVGGGMLMLTIGIGINVVDKLGGADGIAASAEAMRQDVRDAVVPDVDFSMADMFRDPAIERAFSERAAAGGAALPFQHQALIAMMDGSRRQLLQAQLERMCGESAQQKLSQQDCEIAQTFVNTDFSKFGPGGEHYAGLTGADPAAKDEAFKALYGSIGMDESTYDQVFKSLEDAQR